MKGAKKIGKIGHFILSDHPLTCATTGCEEKPAVQDDEVIVIINDTKHETEKLDLIVSLEYVDGQRVEFYELPNGEVAVSATGPMKAEPVLTSLVLRMECFNE